MNKIFGEETLYQNLQICDTNFTYIDTLISMANEEICNILNLEDVLPDLSFYEN